jgi:hypothetical protein
LDLLHVVSKIDLHIFIARIGHFAIDNPLLQGGSGGHIVAKIRIGNWQVDKKLVAGVTIASILLLSLIIVVALDILGAINVVHLDLFVLIVLMSILVLAASVIVSMFSP